MRVESSTKHEEGFEYNCTDLVQVWRSSLFILLEVDFALFHKYEVCLIAIWKAWKHPERKLNPEEHNVSDSSQPVFWRFSLKSFSSLLTVLSHYLMGIIMLDLQGCCSMSCDWTISPAKKSLDLTIQWKQHSSGWLEVDLVEYISMRQCARRNTIIVLDQQQKWSLETLTFSNMQCKQTAYYSSL